MSARGLTIVGASAGSGKTHRLTQEVLGALTRDGVPLEGLVAVTYTKRAQVELASRIRRTLLASDAPERAARLPLANVGTVHAACLRLVREEALDVGLSPAVDVLPDAERLLRSVLELELPTTMQAELLRLATRMAIGRDDRQQTVDWVAPVVDVITLARHGRIRPEALAGMAQRSITSLHRLLPPPCREDLDAHLRDAIDVALRAVEASGCSTKTTASAVVILVAARRALGKGELDWPTWRRLAALTPGKKAREAVAEVVTIAGRLVEHPRLHEDLATFTRLVFEAAATTMAAYARAKAERHVVDYVDMIDEALRVLDVPSVAAELGERLRLVVVDELQDSSPIQLALFLRLHALAGTSRWVGDPKQCIFEYAGADPALMDCALRWAEASGGATDRLEENHRSRPDLVEACSALFETAFAAHAVAREDVRVRPRRALPEALAALPPVGVWTLETQNKSDDAVAIAEGVRRMLARPKKTPVVDRTTGEVRPVRPGDVAIVVATNAEAEAIAAALAAHHIGVAVARSGLLATPEGEALRAALSLVADPGATLDEAILVALHGFEGTTADAWLSGRIREVARRREERETAVVPGDAGDAGDAGDDGDEGDEGDEERGADGPPWRRRLHALRERRELLSPAEMVDAVLGAIDLAALCARWPDATQRLANVDALRALAAQYEARCVEVGEGASIAGLLRFLGDLATPVYLRGEELASDAQAEARGDHAVTIITYHRSKGLEWPVVVLGSLDREGRRTPFDVVPETDAETLDPDDPLRDRWIRYWPWPLGNGNHPLRERADRSPEGIGVAVRESRERVRLLYVGFTRARDHLVLALRPGKTRWLDELRAADGRPALAFPPEGDRRKVLRVLCTDGRDHEVPVRWTNLAAEEPESLPGREVAWFDRVERAPVEGRYRVLPSEAAEAGLALPALEVGACERIHPPLLLATRAETAWNEVGSAIHAFLAADVDGLAPGERRARAVRLLAEVGLGGDDDVARVITSADALRAWVAGRWPGATWRREVPVRARVHGPTGEREIVGTIDLLLELPGGEVIILDHKSDRVLDEGGWRARAAVHAPQLAAYALAVGEAGRRVAGCFVVFVVGGGVVALSPERSRARR